MRSGPVSFAREPEDIEHHIVVRAEFWRLYEEKEAAQQRAAKRVMGRMRADRLARQGFISGNEQGVTHVAG